MKDNTARKLTQQISDDDQHSLEQRDFEVRALPWLKDLYGAASCLVQNDSEAQDLVQLAICEAYKSWAEFRPWTNCRVWLFGFLATAYIDQFRPFPRLTEALNDAFWPEGYHVVLQPAIQPRLDEFGKAIPISMNTAINIASYTEEFQPRSRFGRRVSGNGSNSDRSPRLNTALNEAFESESYQPKREFPTSLRTSAFDEKVLSQTCSNDAKSAIRALPDDDRLLMVLSLVAGFSCGEIAQIAGIRLSTVQSRLPRGRSLLKASFVACPITDLVYDMSRQSEEQ